MSTATFSDRVHSLIERVYSGNVLEASKQIGVPYATLTRVINEPNRSPRSDTLQRIGDHFGVGVDTLLTGSGKGEELASGALDLNDFDYPWSDLFKWADVVDALPLTAEAQVAMFDLPMAVRSASSPFNDAAIDRSGAAPQWRASYREAFHLQVRAWTTFFEGWVSAVGPAGVAEAIHANLTAVQLGFSRNALLAVHAGKLDPAVVAQVAQGSALTTPTRDRLQRLYEGSRQHQRLSDLGDVPPMVKVDLAGIRRRKQSVKVARPRKR